jgi:RNA-directed DNA polymerase
MAGTSSPITVSTTRQRRATRARQAPERVLTTLAHPIEVPVLREAYRRTRKDGAVGVDGQTAQAYAEDLESNLASLLHRCKSGTSDAPAVRRGDVPKDNGTASRPIGMPSCADKVLQRAVAMGREAVYAQDVRDGSYGCRPTRAPHHALEAVRNQGMERRGGWVITIDSKS